MKVFQSKKFKISALSILTSCFLSACLSNSNSNENTSNNGSETNNLTANSLSITGSPNLSFNSEANSFVETDSNSNEKSFVLSIASKATQQQTSLQDTILSLEKKDSLAPTAGTYNIVGMLESDTTLKNVWGGMFGIFPHDKKNDSNQIVTILTGGSITISNVSSSSYDYSLNATATTIPLQAFFGKMMEVMFSNMNCNESQQNCAAKVNTELTTWLNANGKAASVKAKGTSKIGTTISN